MITMNSRDKTWPHNLLAICGVLTLGGLLLGAALLTPYVELANIGSLLAWFDTRWVIYPVIGFLVLLTLVWVITILSDADRDSEDPDSVTRMWRWLVVCIAVGMAGVAVALAVANGSLWVMTAVFILLVALTALVLRWLAHRGKAPSVADDDESVIDISTLTDGGAHGLSDIDDEDVIVSARRYWLSLWWRALTLAIAVSVVLFMVAYETNNEQSVVTSKAWFTLGMATIAGEPILARVWSIGHFVRSRGLRKPDVLMSLVGVTAIGIGVWFLSEREIDLDWLVAAAADVWFATLDAVRFISSSWVHANAFFAVLIVMKVAMVLYEWIHNPYEVHETMLVAPRGIFVRVRPAIMFEHVTDLDPSNIPLAPWFKIRLSNAEEYQSVDTIGWVPIELMPVINERMAQSGD